MGTSTRIAGGKWPCMLNKYACRSKISEAKTRRLIRAFVEDRDSADIAAVSGVNRNTVNRFLRGIRERLTLDEHLASGHGMLTYDVLKVASERMQAREGSSSIRLRAHVIASGGKIFFAESGMSGSVPGSDCCRAELSVDGSRRVAVQCVGGDAANVRTLKRFTEYLDDKFALLHPVPGYALYFHVLECAFKCNNSPDEAYSKVLRLLRSHPL